MSVRSAAPPPGGAVASAATVIRDDGDPSARIDLVLVSHHSASEALELLEGARPWLRESGLRALVLENGSGAAEADTLRGWAGPLTLAVSPANRGFGAGVNALARLGRAPWLLLINPDVEPAAGLFGAVLDHAASAAAGIVGGVRQGPGPRSFGAFPHLLERLSPRCIEDAPRAVAPTDWVSGCLMLVRRRLFEQLGGFDEGYFMQMEDIDLCWRASLAGFETVVDPALTFGHRGHLSYARSGRSVDRDFSRSKARFIARRQGRLAGAAYWTLAVLAAWWRGLTRG